MAQALGSVLRQKHTNLEVLAIDDGSTDGTLQELRKGAALDPRVRVMENDENIGLIRTLQRGVKEAKGAYIARMDADDLSYPDRIESQVAFLESQPELGVVSVAADFVDRSGAFMGSHPPRCFGAGAARYMALFGPPVVHAAILARTEVMRQHGYRLAEQTLHTEDYELFTRMLLAGVSFGNISRPLYAIRILADSVSRRYEEIQIKNFVTCARQYLWAATGIDMPAGVHRAFVNRADSRVSPRELAQAVSWVQRLRSRYLSEMDREDPSRNEIVRISGEQCADIFLQAILKGTLQQRFAGLALAATYAPTLLAAGALGYLRLKAESARRHRLV